MLFQLKICYIIIIYNINTCHDVEFAEISAEKNEETGIVIAMMHGVMIIQYMYSNACVVFE